MPRLREYQKRGQFERDFPTEFHHLADELTNKLSRKDLDRLCCAVFNYGGRRARDEREFLQRTGSDQSCTLDCDCEHNCDCEQGVDS